MNHIVEINGIKMAVDDRTATVQKIDTFKVGDPVKLLYKTYSSYEAKFGVIVGFDNFKNRPTITIAYLDSSDLKYCHIYQGSEHEMLAVDSHDLKLEKTWILDRMKDRIVRKEQELSEDRAKLANFTEMFGKYFTAGIPDASQVG